MTATADTNQILLDISQGIARITIDRRAHLNALNSKMRAELSIAIDRAAATTDVHVIVLSGAGPKAFVAGADIEELIDLTPTASVALSTSIAELHEKLETIPLTVIAAIRGWCLGGGLELALAADLRIASETARFGLPEIKLGIVPGGGGIARVARIAGAPAARHLCITGAIIDAKRALEIGLVSEVYADGVFDAQIEALAASLAALSQPALQAMKKALQIGCDLPLTEAVQQEAHIGAQLYGTPEQRAAMSDFLAAREHRKNLK